MHLGEFSIPGFCALNISSNPRLPQPLWWPRILLTFVLGLWQSSWMVWARRLILHISLSSYGVLMPLGLSWKKYIFRSLDFSFSDTKIFQFYQILLVPLKNLPFPMLFTAEVGNSNSSWPCRKPTGIKGTWWAWLLNGVCMYGSRAGKFRATAVGAWGHGPRAAATSYTFSREAKNSCFLSNTSIFQKTLAPNSIKV